MIAIDRQDALNLALSMYIGEPCRICGKTIEKDDMIDALFAGYSKNNESRTMHKKCWNENRDRSTWAIPE
jgi:hypothetical protein